MYEALVSGLGAIEDDWKYVKKDPKIQLLLFRRRDTRYIQLKCNIYMLLASPATYVTLQTRTQNSDITVVARLWWQVKRLMGFYDQYSPHKINSVFLHTDTFTVAFKKFNDCLSSFGEIFQVMGKSIDTDFEPSTTNH